MIPHDRMKAAYDQGCADTIEHIAAALDHMSDDYIPMPVAKWDVWEFCAVLAKMVRAGDLTKPLPQGPPF